MQFRPKFNDPDSVRVTFQNDFTVAGTLGVDPLYCKLNDIRAPCTYNYASLPSGTTLSV